jgi:hypothetical protein
LSVPAAKVTTTVPRHRPESPEPELDDELRGGADRRVVCHSYDLDAPTGDLADSPVADRVIRTPTWRPLASRPRSKRHRDLSRGNQSRSARSFRSGSQARSQRVCATPARAAAECLDLATARLWSRHKRAPTTPGIDPARRASRRVRIAPGSSRNTRTPHVRPAAFALCLAKRKAGMFCCRARRTTVVRASHPPHGAC